MLNVKNSLPEWMGQEEFKLFVYHGLSARFKVHGTQGVRKASQKQGNLSYES